jgi:hypothetical protein
MHKVRPLTTSPDDLRLCRDVYLRSWPVTAGGVYTPEQMRRRFEQVDDLGFWHAIVDGSDRRFTGTTVIDGVVRHGFATAHHEDGAWEFGWLFVEPEAFGSGLADALYTATVEDIEGPWFGFILDGNVMSPRFLASRGWRKVPGEQPDWAIALGHRYRRYETVRQHGT